MLWASSQQLGRQLVRHLWFLLDLDARAFNGLRGLEPFLGVDLCPLPITDSRLVDQGREQLLAQTPRAALASIDSRVLRKVADQRQQAAKRQPAGEQVPERDPVVVLKVGLDLAGLLRDQEDEAEDSPVFKP